MTKLMSNDRKESLASAPTLLRALALIPDEQEEFRSHPHHIMLPLDADAKNILGAPAAPGVAAAGCFSHDETGAPRCTAHFPHCAAEAPTSPPASNGK